jgi:hypothetical protein
VTQGLDDRRGEYVLDGEGNRLELAVHTADVITVLHLVRNVMPLERRHRQG